MARFYTFSTAVRATSLARIHKHVGFSLIEVMVTLVILSVGLLGVAGLIMRGVSNASASESMAKASLLATDMADRIRANPAKAIAANNGYLRSFGNPIPDTDGIAHSDVNAWLKSLNAQLPQGDGEITLDDALRKVVIGVRWSNCQGTLSQSDQIDCKNNSATAFKSITYELRL